MANTIPFPERGSDDRAFLDCERLDVYRVAVEFHQTATRICLDRRIGANLRNQLDRASVSIVLCIAEGAGRRPIRDKARFYDMACGSATECAAVLDLLETRALLTAVEHRQGRGQLVRIIQMLTRLISRS
jgi:four helix bundle protein